ncbi:hypothetical protein NL676_025309 [Syzygium grande]|nr:hypothetical protein NL676_025309 [Syzygium grande]
MSRGPTFPYPGNREIQRRAPPRDPARPPTAPHRTARHKSRAREIVTSRGAPRGREIFSPNAVPVLGNLGAFPERLGGGPDPSLATALSSFWVPLRRDRSMLSWDYYIRGFF